MAVTIKRFFVLLVLCVMFLGASWLGVYLNRTSPLEWTGGALSVWEKEAFDHIGNQGIKTNVALDALEGTYQGDVVMKTDQEKALRFVASGSFSEGQLTLSWLNAQNEAEGMNHQVTLKTGILRLKPGPQEDQSSFFGVVKVYPSNHMLDVWVEAPVVHGDGTKSHTSWHFQIIKQ